MTGITASSTIGIFDSLPEYIQIGQQPGRSTIYATYTGSGNTGGYYPIATIYDQNQRCATTRSRRTPWMLPSTAKTGASSTTVASMSPR